MLNDVSSDIQFAVNEECLATRNCDQYATFISPRRQGWGRNSRQKLGKPVFHIEYTDESKKGGPVKRNVSSAAVAGLSRTERRQCLERNRLGKLFSTTIKRVNLDGWVLYCDGVTVDTSLEKGVVVKGLAKECKGN
jgi:Glycoside-hydrolase family GH114